MSVRVMTKHSSKGREGSCSEYTGCKPVSAVGGNGNCSPESKQTPVQVCSGEVEVGEPGWGGKVSEKGSCPDSSYFCFRTISWERNPSDMGASFPHGKASIQQGTQICQRINTSET